MAGQKALQAGVLRVVKDLRRCALLLNPAIGQKDDPVRHRPRKVHLMGGQQHGHVPGRQLADDLQHPAHQLRVERGGRLIQQHQLRPGGNRTADAHPLLLPAGQVGGISVLLVLQPHQLQHLARLLPGLLLAHLLDPDQRLGDVLQRRLVGKQAVLLKDHRRLRPQLVLLPAGNSGRLHRHLPDGDAALVGQLQQVDAAQQRRFAGAGRADHRHHLALMHLQIDAVQHHPAVKGFF